MCWTNATANVMQYWESYYCIISGIAFPWRVTIGTLVTFAVGVCFKKKRD